MNVKEQQFLWMIFQDPMLGVGLGKINLTDQIANHYYQTIQNPETCDIFLAAEAMGIESNTLINYFDQFMYSGYEEKNASKLIDFVKNYSVVNSFMSTMTEAMQEIRGAKNKREVVDQTIDKLMQVIGNNSSNTQSTLGEAVVETIEYLEDVAAGKIDRGLSFGIPSVDKAMGGARGGDLVILAGRSGSGKTAAALQFCVNQLRVGKRGMIYSLEMQKKNLVMRMTANMSERSLTDIKSGQLMNDEAVFNQMNFMMNKQKAIIIDDKGGKAISEINNDSRIENLKNGIDYIMIDYAQLITDDISTGKNTFKTESIGKITRSLKSLAKELDIPVILLAQVARDVDKNTVSGWQGKPIKANISDSKEIENDADIICLLYAPYRYEKHKNDPALKGKVLFDFAKSRDGEEGEAWVDFNGSHQKFSELFGETPIPSQDSSKSSGLDRFGSR